MRVSVTPDIYGVGVTEGTEEPTTGEVLSLESTLTRVGTDGMVLRIKKTLNRCKTQSLQITTP